MSYPVSKSYLKELSLNKEISEHQKLVSATIENISVNVVRSAKAKMPYYKMTVGEYYINDVLLGVKNNFPDSNVSIIDVIGSKQIIIDWSS